MDVLGKKPPEGYMSRKNFIFAKENKILKRSVLQSHGYHHRRQRPGRNSKEYRLNTTARIINNIKTIHHETLYKPPRRGRRHPLRRVSCNKDNPKEENYASVDFELKINEVRQSKTFTWDVTGNKVAIDPAEQELQELWVTAWNTVTVTALPLATGFQGANYSSSDPKKVKVTKVDDQSCTIEYVADTEGNVPVTITAKAGTYVHSFSVYTKEVIMITGIEFWHDFNLDGNEELTIANVGIRNSQGGADMQHGTAFTQIQNDLPKTERHKIYIRIGKLVPENASFRYVVKTEVVEKSDEQIATFPRGSQQKDFEEFVGLETYMNKNNTNLIVNTICFFFNVNSKTPVNNGNFDGGCFYTWYNP